MYENRCAISNYGLFCSEYVELARARATLQETVERRGLPVFTDIPAALRCARAVLRGARTHPRQSLGHTILRLKRVYDAAGGRNGRLSRTKAIDALRDMTNSTQDVDRCLPPSANYIDFEMFCAAVAELATDAGELNQNRRNYCHLIAFAGIPFFGLISCVIEDKTFEIIIQIG